jgi:hypothetical protein
MGLTQTRQDLAAALEVAGYPVKDHVPEQISPPMILISTGDPYVENSDTFKVSEKQVHMELLLIAGSGANVKKIEALETMIEDVIVVLHNQGWKFSGASAPFEATVNQSVYLVSRVTTSNLFEI